MSGVILIKRWWTEKLSIEKTQKTLCKGARWTYWKTKSIARKTRWRIWCEKRTDFTFEEISYHWRGRCERVFGAVWNEYLGTEKAARSKLKDTFFSRVRWTDQKTKYFTKDYVSLRRKSWWTLRTHKNFTKMWNIRRNLY